MMAVIAKLTPAINTDEVVAKAEPAEVEFLPFPFTTVGPVVPFVPVVPLAPPEAGSSLKVPAPSL